ncbi:hypothetical protein RA19_07260 [Leisingera sp. ANG-M1]|uniref:NACHT domain-containing protein n=1 Tax=Leisingera sp. ANG-M1 TaxID=1577895 RepID=UPI00057E5AF0|nr:ATP-binding protein [Leisingera sp. ANG-M1]KIC11150.1 hypothetical protein RA19_07260 [Leisingera sp. ANG-M1]
MDTIEKIISRTLSGVDNLGQRIELTQPNLTSVTEPLVILGEAGMGKTTLLRQISEEAGHTFVSARRLVRSRAPENLIGGAATVVVDALDELSTQLEGGSVDEVLAALEIGGASHFILACRAADWRSATNRQSIADIYGTEPLELFLNPIERPEALSLLSQDMGEDRAGEVLTHFEANGLEELFGNPQTLNLIRAVANLSELPTSRGELFDLSIRQLWAEHNPKKSETSLAKLSEDRALNAAGGVFASLLLTGKRALSRLSDLNAEEDDLTLAEVGELVATEELEAVLGSRLFSSNVEGCSERFNYSHRSVGEFLAAKWLANQADTNRKSRRLLKLFHVHGLVPASLRGVHAWLVRDSKLAIEVIDADPLGVIEYGDTANFSEQQARALLLSLFKFGESNPRYYDFETNHALRGIAKPELIQEIRELIVSASTPISLRVLLLNAISTSPVARSLSGTLLELLLDPDTTFIERRRAGDALAALTEAKIEWRSIFSKLHDLADENSLRIAIELLPRVEFADLSNEQLVQLVVAFGGLSICEFPQNKKTRVGGVLWGFETKLPDDRIEPVLDILADYLLTLISDDSDRFEISDVINVVYSLTKRRLALKQTDPIKLWRWLSCVGEHRGFREDAQRTISQWLQDHVKARRAIQRIALLEEPGEKTIWMKAWRLNDQLPGLLPDEEDVVELLQCLKPPEETAEDRWKDIVQLCPHDARRGAKARAAAKPFAQNQNDTDFLEKLANPEVPEWQKKQEERDRERASEKQKKWEAHRADYRAHIEDLRRGHYGSVIGPAQAYLNRFSDMGDNLPAHQRIEEWLGSELQQAAFQGFEAFLLDNNAKPSANEVAESYAESKNWPAAEIFIAATAERVRNNISLDELPDDRLLAILLEVDFHHILNHAGLEHVREELDRVVETRHGLRSRYWRLRIEPQLAAGRTLVDGIYEFVRQVKNQELILPLVKEWLERFPDMSLSAEMDLVGYAISCEETEFVRNISIAYRQEKTLAPERRSDWDAISFIVNFEAEHETLTKERGNDPEFLWNLRSRIAPRHGEAQPVALGPKQLAWIIRTFRSHWTNVSQPTGSSVGDNNPWDAAEFLHSLIRRLGNLTSPLAIEELSLLIEAPSDGYTRSLKTTFWEQAQKIVEEKYSPPKLKEIASVLRDAPPNSTEQLQAVMIEELRVAQNKIRSHPVDWYQDFFWEGIPKDEEKCRDTLLKILGEFPSGILCEPEGHLADDKRVDIKCSVGSYMLPIEIKGQWHSDLWSAADDQLDRLYSNDWRAEHRGIFLVFWFGVNVPDNKKLQSPGRNKELPKTASELRSALVKRSKAATQGRIEIFVIDLDRPLKK